jgi:hypothetical protein
VSALGADPDFSPEGWWNAEQGDVGPAGLPVNSTSLAYETFRVVKSGAGTCYGFSGYDSGVAGFVLAFDALPSATTGGVIANGSIPVAICATGADGNFSFSWGTVGRAFSRGIIVANSTTGPTLTLGSATCWFDVQYL